MVSFLNALVCIYLYCISVNASASNLLLNDARPGERARPRKEKLKKRREIRIVAYCMSNENFHFIEKCYMLFVMLFINRRSFHYYLTRCIQDKNIFNFQFIFAVSPVRITYLYRNSIRSVRPLHSSRFYSFSLSLVRLAWLIWRLHCTSLEWCVNQVYLIESALKTRNNDARLMIHSQLPIIITSFTLTLDKVRLFVRFKILFLISCIVRLLVVYKFHRPTNTTIGTTRFLLDIESIQVCPGSRKTLLRATEQSG